MGGEVIYNSTDSHHNSTDHNSHGGSHSFCEHICVEPISEEAAASGLSSGLSLISHQLLAAYIVVALFAVCFDESFGYLELRFKGTSHQIIIQRIYRTIMVIGLSVLSVKMLEAAQLSPSHSWLLSYEFADICSFFTALFFALHGFTIMFLSIGDANAWERAGSIRVEELLIDVDAVQTKKSRLWKAIYFPFCRARDQVEFRVFRMIFSSTYHISGDPLHFSYAKLLKMTHECNLLALIDFDAWKWFVILLITGLISLKMKFVYAPHCATQDCVALFELKLFTAGGFLLLLMTCMLAIVGRNSELKLLKKFGIEDVSDYEVFLMKEEELLDKMAPSVLTKKDLSVVVSDLKHESAVRLFKKQHKLIVESTAQDSGDQDYEAAAPPSRRTTLKGVVNRILIRVLSRDHVQSSGSDLESRTTSAVANAVSRFEDDSTPVRSSKAAPGRMSFFGQNSAVPLTRSSIAGPSVSIASSSKRKTKPGKSIFDVVSETSARKQFTAGVSQKCAEDSVSRISYISSPRVQPYEQISDSTPKSQSQQSQPAYFRQGSRGQSDGTKRRCYGRMSSQEAIPQAKNMALMDELNDNLDDNGNSKYVETPVDPRKLDLQEQVKRKLREAYGGDVHDNHNIMFADIYLFGRPEFFNSCVNIFLTGNSLYLSWWLTTFTFAAARTSTVGSAVLWFFFPLIPAICSLYVLALAIRSSTTLRALTEIDLDIVSDVMDKTEEIRKYVNLLRKSLLHRLKILGMQNERKAVSDLFEEVEDSQTGSMSVEDFRRMLVRLQMFLDAAVWAGMFSWIDLNQDGFISLEVI
jgi:hypothetical protein